MVLIRVVMKEIEVVVLKGEVALNLLNWVLRSKIELIDMPSQEKSKAEALYVIIVSILVCDRMATVLFDPVSTYSYIFVKFSLGLEMVCGMLDLHMYASSLVGDHVMVTQVYRTC